MNTDRTVNVNGVEINVVDVGEGTSAFVFLHYWGGSSRTWMPVIDILATAHRCVAIDFRGWGKSSKDAANYDLQTLANDVINVVDVLGLKHFTIVGHSMGGKVAQLVAAQRPDGLERLILVAPAPPCPINAPLEQREAMIASYNTRDGAIIVIDILSALPLTAGHREQIVQDTLCGAPAAKRAWPEVGMIEDISKQALQIDVPIHVIVGSADRIETERVLRESFSQSDLVAIFTVLQGVGHLPMLEASAELADAILVASNTA